MSGSMAEQSESSQPPCEQRLGLFGRSRRRNGGGRGGLLGRRFLVWDGGAVVQV